MSTTVNDYYDPSLKRDRLDTHFRRGGVRVSANVMWPTVAALFDLLVDSNAGPGPRRAPRRPARGAALDRAAVRLPAGEPRRPAGDAGGLPPAAGPATGAAAASSTRVPRRCTAPVSGHAQFARTSGPTTRFRCTERQRSRARSWRSPMPTSTGSRLQGSASLPSTDRGAGRTCLRGYSPPASSPENPSACSTTVRMKRDFTHIADIVRGVVSALDRPPAARRGRCAPPDLQSR